MEFSNISQSIFAEFKELKKFSIFCKIKNEYIFADSELHFSGQN